MWTVDCSFTRKLASSEFPGIIKPNLAMEFTPPCCHVIVTSSMYFYTVQSMVNKKEFCIDPGGGGDSHMEQTGMLVKILNLTPKGV